MTAGWGELIGTCLAAAGAGAPGAGGEGIIPFTLYFLLISFVVALVSSAIRLRDAGQIAREASRFFVTIVVGIFVFSLVVFALEWLFIRPLI